MMYSWTRKAIAYNKVANAKIHATSKACILVVCADLDGFEEDRRA
jgi:hypothetical protein